MKISFLCLAIYAYVVYASEESGEPETMQAVQDNAPAQGYVPYDSYPVRPPLGYYPPRRQPQPQRSGGLNLSNPIVLYILLMALTPKTTTTTAATTMAPVSTATPDPCEGWTKVGDCCYLLPDTTATWDAAQNECARAKDGGRLAVKGFSLEWAERIHIVNQQKAARGVSFWIGVKGEVNNPSVDTTFYTAPLETTDPTRFPISFKTKLYDGASVNDDVVVCARVDAADADTLVFELCAAEARRYMCEVCLA